MHSWVGSCHIRICGLLSEVLLVEIGQKGRSASAYLEENALQWPKMQNMWPVRFGHWDSLRPLLSLRLLPKMHQRRSSLRLLPHLLENFQPFPTVVQRLPRKMLEDRLWRAGYCVINAEILPVMQSPALGLSERHRPVHQNRCQAHFIYLMICQYVF